MILNLGNELGYAVKNIETEIARRDGTGEKKHMGSISLANISQKEKYRQFIWFHSVV